MQLVGRVSEVAAVRRAATRLIQKYHSYEAAQEYGEHFSTTDDPLGLKQLKNLRSHCGKKHSVYMMGSVPGLSSVATCFRAGWIMRNVHTLFDFLASTTVNDVRSAKALSG